MLLLNTMERNALEHYKNTKERVLFIYGKSQGAVDSNTLLLSYYKQVFGEDDLCEESITRSGRWWRSNERTRKGERQFHRCQDLKARDNALRDLNKLSAWV